MKPKDKEEVVEKLEYLKLPYVARLLKVRTESLYKFQRESGLAILELAPHTHRIRRDLFEQWLKSREEGKE